MAKRISSPPGVTREYPTGTLPLELKKLGEAELQKMKTETAADVPGAMKGGLDPTMKRRT